MKTIEDITAYAQDHSVPVMMEDGLAFLLETIQNNRYLNILEIGTAIARTALAMAELDPRIRITTIEKDPAMIAQARINIAQSPCSSQIQLLEGDARTVHVTSGPFDLIFIDAAKSQYERFFVKYAPMLSPDGIIVSDNMNFHGLVEHPERTHNRHTKALLKKIRSYKEFLSQLEGFQTEFLERGDGIAVTRRI